MKVSALLWDHSTEQLSKLIQKHFTANDQQAKLLACSFPSMNMCQHTWILQQNEGKSRKLLLNLLLIMKSLQDLFMQTFFGPFSRMKQQLSLPISSQAKKIFKINCSDRKQEIFFFLCFVSVASPAVRFLSCRLFPLWINYRFDKLHTCCSQRSGVVNLKPPFIS